VVCKWISELLSAASRDDVEAKFRLLITYFNSFQFPGLAISWNTAPKKFQSHQSCPASQEDGERVIFDLVKWTADSANGFYRGLYKHGVWIPRDDVPVLCAHGWGITDP